MSHQSSLKPASLELRVVLENGYILIQDKNIYRTPRISRSWEKGFNQNSFNHAVFQGLHVNEYYAWEMTLVEAFSNANLSYPRFRRQTEDYDEKTDSNLPAAQLKRMIDELDKIVNSNEIFISYILPENEYSPVYVKEGLVIQGYSSHKFTTDPPNKLIEMLWNSRRIESSKGKELKAPIPLERKEIYEALGVDHERFKDIVRGIKIEMKRKRIHLDIKFPTDVTMIVIQDSM